MYYASTITLRMTEEQFWKCTPRKLFALLDVHNHIINPTPPKPKVLKGDEAVAFLMGIHKG